MHKLERAEIDRPPEFEWPPNEALISAGILWLEDEPRVFLTAADIELGSAEPGDVGITQFADYAPDPAALTASSVARADVRPPEASAQALPDIVPRLRIERPVPKVVPPPSPEWVVSPASSATPLLRTFSYAAAVVVAVAGVALAVLYVEGHAPFGAPVDTASGTVPASVNGRPLDRPAETAPPLGGQPETPAAGSIPPTTPPNAPTAAARQAVELQSGANSTALPPTRELERPALPIQRQVEVAPSTVASPDSPAGSVLPAEPKDNSDRQAAAAAGARVTPDAAGSLTPAALPPAAVVPAPALVAPTRDIPARLGGPAPPLPPPSLPGPAAETAVTLRLRDAESIQQVLQRYALAYEQLDASAAQLVWPSVDVRALARAFGGLESQKVAFTACTLNIDGVEALALCKGTTTYVPKFGSKDPRRLDRDWVFQLKKTDGSWLIARSEAK